MTRVSAFRMLSILLNHHRILIASVRVELAKRYSGSLLGKLWVVLYPLLFLSIYLFVYMIVFNMQFPGSSRLDYVVFVFAGLIPYIGFMEAVTGGCVSLKQNMHLIKNVMMPIDLIPARFVLVAMVTEMVGLAMLLALAAMNGGLGLHLLGLPVILLFQLIMLEGLVLILAPMAVVLPDLAYFVNLAVLLLMFVSPIGFQPEMVPSAFRFVVYANPIYYMVDAFRSSLIGDHPFNWKTFFGYAAFSSGVFLMGSSVFTKLRGSLIDYE